MGSPLLFGFSHVHRLAWLIHQSKRFLSLMGSADSKCSTGPKSHQKVPSMNLGGVASDVALFEFRYHQPFSRMVNFVR